MPLPRILRVALQFFVSHGPLHGLRVLAMRFHRRGTPHLTSPLDLFPRQIPSSIHPFDLKYNVNTSGFQHGEDLGASPHPTHAPLLPSSAVIAETSQRARALPSVNAPAVPTASESARVPVLAAVSDPAHASSAKQPSAGRQPSSPLLPSTLWNTAYYGIAPSLFDRALALIPPASPCESSPPTLPEGSPAIIPEGPPAIPDWRPFTFVDLGCGKGRALLLASRYAFQQILGVELDATLAATAQANLLTFNAPWQQCHALAALHADATTIDLPLTPLLLYLYHPFLAPALKQVLRRLERSLRQHPRELWLVYINPEAAHVLRAFPFLRYVTHTILTLDPEDAIPDRLGSFQEEVAIYHVPLPA